MLKGELGILLPNKKGKKEDPRRHDPGELKKRERNLPLSRWNYVKTRVTCYDRMTIQKRTHDEGTIGSLELENQAG